MRERLVAYWWVWLLIALLGGIGNEVYDSSVNGGSHPAADVLIGVVLALVVCYISGVVARRRGFG
jgi:ABC-type transporter Mla maintaining outer membrane lipid asymmetry permease subunit MlaE